MTVRYSRSEAVETGATYLLARLGAELLNCKVDGLANVNSPHYYRDHLELVQAAIRKYSEVRRNYLGQKVEKLTHREFQVVVLLVEGYSNREIAKSLHCTEATVKGHLESVCRKLGAKNRVGVVSVAFRLGIVA